MLKTEISNGIIICSFDQVARLNAVNAEKLKEEMYVNFQEPGTRIILDLGNITFIDSMGFGALISVFRKSRNNSGSFKICNIRPDVLRVFRLLQLHTVFEIHETREGCLDSFE